MTLSPTRFKTSIAALLLCAGAPAQAEVTLSFSDQTEILAINGVARSDVNSPLTLADGTNQLLARVRAEVRALGNATKSVSSHAFVLEFDVADRQVVLETPGFRRESDIKRFNRKPAWRLVDSAGSALNLHAVALVKEGFQLNRDFEAELAEFARAREAAHDDPAAAGAKAIAVAPSGGNSRPAAATTGAAEPETPEPPSHPRAEPTSSADSHETRRALEMLKYWYQEADPNTRRAFERWIAR